MTLLARDDQICNMEVEEEEVQEEREGDSFFFFAMIKRNKELK